MLLPVRTTRALLVSAGLGPKSKNRWTWHTYSHSEMVTLPGETKGSTVTGLGHFFKCEETGEVRQWGFDAAFPSVGN